VDKLKHTTARLYFMKYGILRFIVEEKAHAAAIDIPNITIISQSIVDKEIHTAARQSVR
jgi:hypothetical protein